MFSRLPARYTLSVPVSQRPRKTNPIPEREALHHEPSPLWVPVVMSTFLICGVAVILLNLFDVVPNGQSPKFLMLGLAEIIAGFAFATNWH